MDRLSELTCPRCGAPVVVDHDYNDEWEAGGVSCSSCKNSLLFSAGREAAAIKQFMTGQLRLNVELDVESAPCVSVLYAGVQVNGYEYSFIDFGRYVSTDEFRTYEQGCLNVNFVAKPVTLDMLDKFGITVQEFDLICAKLAEGNVTKCTQCETGPVTP